MDDFVNSSIKFSAQELVEVELHSGPLCVTYLLLKNKAKLFHDIFTQKNGQEFIIGDVLNFCDDNSSGFLEENFVVPMRVDV